MPSNDSLEILFRDEHLIVVHKPAGMMVHRSPLAGRGEQFVLQMLRNRIGRRVYPVHRLDKPTSGALLFSLDPETAGIMAGYFAHRQVQKTYLAVVRGFLDEQGTVDLPLRGDVYRKRPEEILKTARTGFVRLCQIEVPHPVGPYATARYSLLQVTPETGRMHQIRRHLRDIAHPVVGDRRYGDNRHNRFFKETIGCGRLMLAAVELGFTHPVTGHRLAVTAPLGPNFQSVLERFGWTDAVPTRWRRENGR
ncbi:MAG: pseudouridine synthase [Desulfobacterales bacterium]|jgi:tRNA pseudouridine65 synthase